MFWISVVIFFVMLVTNMVFKSSGSYKDYTKFMTSLAQAPYSRKEQPTAVARDSRGETKCRSVMETLTGKKFDKCRPDFLRNNVTNANLELDCYNDELGLAVEYNGRQHYEYVPHFHKNREAFNNVKYRDDIKKRLCEENGVELIVVPYTVREDDIESYLANALLALKV